MALARKLLPPRSQSPATSSRSPEGDCEGEAERRKAQVLVEKVAASGWRNLSATEQARRDGIDPPRFAPRFSPRCVALRRRSTTSYGGAHCPISLRRRSVTGAMRGSSRPETRSSCCCGDLPAQRPGRPVVVVLSHGALRTDHLGECLGEYRRLCTHRRRCLVRTCPNYSRVGRCTVRSAG